MLVKLLFAASLLSLLVGIWLREERLMVMSAPLLLAAALAYLYNAAESCRDDTND